MRKRRASKGMSGDVVSAEGSVVRVRAADLEGSGGEKEIHRCESDVIVDCERRLTRAFHCEGVHMCRTVNEMGKVAPRGYQTCRSSSASSIRQCCARYVAMVFLFLPVERVQVVETIE
jgi:hypothetical protein